MTQPLHTFHIPVMGLAFTIDTPIRLAHYGISSVVAITDDELIEKMRAFYSSKFKKPYAEITQKMEDFRAQRITHYLNLMDELVKEKFESLGLKTNFHITPTKWYEKRKNKVYMNDISYTNPFIA